MYASVARPNTQQETTYILMRHQQQLLFPPKDPPALTLANTQATHQTVAINQNHKPSDGYLYLGSGNQNICTLTDP